MSSDDELLARLKRDSYRRKGPDGNEVIGIEVGLQGRNYERSRRCQNCRHLLDKEKTLKLRDDCIARDQRTWRLQGLSKAVASNKARKLRHMLSTGIHGGKVGACGIRDRRTDGNAGDDFVHLAFVCDMWSGHVIFRPDDVDLLPAELREELDKKR